MTTGRLEKLIADLSSFVKKRCPEAIIQVSYSTYDGEDADMEIFVDPEMEIGIHDELSQKAAEILVDEGYHIATLVFSLEDYKKRQLKAVES